MLACSCSVCTWLEIEVTAQMYASHVHVYMLFCKSDDCSQVLKLQAQLQNCNMPSGMSTRVRRMPAADLYQVQHSSVAVMCLIFAVRMLSRTGETMRRAIPGTRQDSCHCPKDCVKKPLPGTIGMDSKTKTGMWKSYSDMMLLRTTLQSHALQRLGKHKQTEGAHLNHALDLMEAL